jgi:hypothetical protein
MARAMLVLIPVLATSGAPLAAQEHQRHDPATGVADTQLSAELEAVRAATERYRDHANAVADGYVLFGQEGPLMGEHWLRRDLVREPLDLNRPSTLQYAWVDGRRELVGVAYTTYRRPGDPMPEGFSGDDDAWHVHDIERIGKAVAEGRPLMRRLAERWRRETPAADGRSELTMLHAWIWQDNPDGVFALENRALPYLRVGLPAAWSASGDLAAARGTSLLAEGSCKREMRRMNFLARLSKEQRATLEAGCTSAAARVADARTAADEAEMFNREAAAAWSIYAASLARTLTPEQIERLGSVTEQAGPAHGRHGH